MQNRVEPKALSGSEVTIRGDRAAPIDFDQLLSVARRQARVVLGSAVVGLLLGLAYVTSATPQYTATTNLLIDSQKDKTALGASIAELNFDAGAIDSQVEVLKSEKIALSVISNLNLTNDTEFAGGKTTIFGAAFSILRRLFDASGWFVYNAKTESEQQFALQRAAVSQLKGNLDVRRVARTYVLAIQYTSPNNGKAATIANAFADAYLVEQLDAKFESTRRAAGWLQTRLAELKQQSVDADFAIQKFKAEHGIVVTGGDRPGLMSDQQLTELSSQLTAAQSDTARAEARFAQIDGLLRTAHSGVAVPDSLANPVINEIRGKYLAASKTEAQLESKLGPAHLQVIELRREMEEYERLIYDELRRIAESYKSDAEVARAKEKNLQDQLAGLIGKSALTNQTLVQLRELERDSETYKTLTQTFNQRYQEALQQQSFPVTEARVITSATGPGAPSYPKRGSILALALVFGALIGSGAAALREYQDRVFRVAAHVRDELGLEFLGLLQSIDTVQVLKPVANADNNPRHIRPISSVMRYAIDHPLSSFSETLRSAKVAIDISLGGRRPKIVGVISTLPGEGKSTISKNLASLLAHLGARTLLVDADLRNPGLTRAIGRHADAGLLEAVRGDYAAESLLLLEPDSGLHFLPAVVKKRVLHSSEILASDAMRKLLTSLCAPYEYVIVDLPPLGPVVDVRAAASLFDVFLFVAEWGRTPRIVAQNLLAGEEVLFEKCVGALYNKVNLKRINLYEGYGSKDYYYGRYSTYYRAEHA